MQNKQLEFEARLLATLEADIAANRLILPSLPEVAMEVRRISERPDVSFNELARAISRDPALAARLLKVANSPALRGRHAVEDLKTAVQRLGLRLVCSLVNSLAIIQAFSHGGNRMQRLLQQVSEHSLQVAALSHALAARYTSLNPEEALLAGLIHDIGKLPLLRRACDMFESQEQIELLAGPCHQLHGHVGAMVLESWQFSPEFVAVARDHEEIARQTTTGPDLVDVVIVANLLADGKRQWDAVPAVRRMGLAGCDVPVTDERYRHARELLGG